MANPNTLFAGLPTRLQNVSNALDELVMVLTGSDTPFTVDGASVSPRDFIWPDEELTVLDYLENEVNPALNSAPIDSNLDTTIETLLEGLGGGSVLGTAIESVVSAIQGIISEAQAQQEEFGAQARIDAFRALNNPHAPNDYGTSPFGFFPAIEGVINAGAGTSVDVDDALAPLAAVAGALDAGQGYAIFVAYATGTLGMLNRAFTL